MDSPEWHSAVSDPRDFIGVDLGQSGDPTAICGGASYRAAGARPGGGSETKAVPGSLDAHRRANASRCENQPQNRGAARAPPAVFNQPITIHHNIKIGA